MERWTNSLFLLISPSISLSLISFELTTFFLFSICSRSVLCVSTVPKALSWIGSAISDFRLLFSHKVGFPHGYKANLLPLNWKGNFHNCIIFHLKLHSDRHAYFLEIENLQKLYLVISWLILRQVPRLTSEAVFLCPCFNQIQNHHYDSSSSIPILFCYFVTKVTQFCVVSPFCSVCLSLAHSFFISKPLQGIGRVLMFFPS